MFGSYFSGNKKKQDAADESVDEKAADTPAPDPQQAPPTPTPTATPITEPAIHPLNKLAEQTVEHSVEEFAEIVEKTNDDLNDLEPEVPELDPQAVEEANRKITDHQANLRSIREQTAGIVREEHPENTPVEPEAVTDHRMQVEEAAHKQEDTYDDEDKKNDAAREETH